MSKPNDDITCFIGTDVDMHDPVHSNDLMLNNTGHDV